MRKHNKTGDLPEPVEALTPRLCLCYRRSIRNSFVYKTLQSCSGPNSFICKTLILFGGGGCTRPFRPAAAHSSTSSKPHLWLLHHTRNIFLSAQPPLWRAPE